MERSELIQRLKTVAARARDLKQIQAAREIEAIVQRLGAKYFFMAHPGGYENLIPDMEYVEFPDEASVVGYVRDTLLQDGPGRSPGELDVIRPQVDFQTARRMLMEVGEFGALAAPIKPPSPNTLVGTRERLASPPRDLQDLKDQLQGVVTKGRLEIIDGVEVDTEKAALLLRFLAAMNPVFGAAAMAMGVAALLHIAYQWAQGAGDTLSGLGKFLGVTSQEAGFYKEVPLMESPEEEEWDCEEAQD